MKLEEFSYELPVELIPAKPDRVRGSARMLTVDRKAGTMQDRQFPDLVDLLDPGDVVVMNDTKVLPTLLRGKTADGAEIRIDLVSDKGDGRWECAVRRIRPLETGTRLIFPEGLEAVVQGPNSHGTGIVADLSLQGDELASYLLEHADYMLPMYLDQDIEGDDYQTVFAKELGSNQPPVAGMHFTPEVLGALQRKGVEVHHITLRIGRLDDLSMLTGEQPVEEHRMYPEAYDVPESTAQAINAAKARGNRLICVGTTSVRSLETVTGDDGVVHGGRGWTNCFITPGYTYKAVDALFSNLQPPKSTNIMLHSAFGGLDLTQKAYQHAVDEGYMFLEFGDCVYYY